MRRVLAVIGMFAVLALAACGGDDEEEPAGGGGATQEESGAGAAADDATDPVPTQEGESAGGTAGGADSAEEGKQVFARTCAGCHTLADAGADGKVGPSLDEVGPDRDQVLSAIQNGPGQMPENLLQGADAEAVADYVSSVAGQS